MSECPEIIVYEHMASERWIPPYIARYLQAGEFLPMIFSGDSVEAVKAAASQFWSTETAKIEAKRAGVAKINEGRQRRRQTVV